MSNVNNDPSLSLPASEQIASDGTIAVSPANYSDSFAASNPGSLFLDITDSSGTLATTNASGNAVSGSGSNSIALNIDYADLNAALNNLTYTAAAANGSDTINYQIWNQSGVETTGSVPVTINGSGGSSETWTGAVSNAWNSAGNWSGGAVPISGDTVTIPGGTANTATLANASLTGENITLTGGGSVAFDNVTLAAGTDLQSSGSGDVSLSGTLAIAATATVAPEAGASLSLTGGGTGSGATIQNAGTIASQAGASIAIGNGGSAANTATLINSGLILVNGGEINVEPAPAISPGMRPPETLINSGTVAITNGGVLTLNGSVASGNVTFSGDGTLTLNLANAFGGSAAIVGFGQGDALELGPLAGHQGTLAFNAGALTVTQNGNLLQTIPFSGAYGIGNFEYSLNGDSISAPAVIAYAPNDGGSGIVPDDITAPATAAVAQGSTLSLGNVSVADINTAAGATIDAGTGTLFVNGSTTSGTSQVTIDQTTPDQLNTDLASLRYVPAAGATADTVSVQIENGSVTSIRQIPIAISAGSSGPALNEPSSETVASGGTTAVSGSYSDSFAQANPGSLFLGITDSSGNLSATNASGQTVAGSGSHSITLNTDYTDLNAVLQSLTYTAGTSGGSDNIHVDIWNQAGKETTGNVPVTITSGTGGGATETWTGAVSSDWNTPANWSGNAVPTSGDTAIIAANTPNMATLTNAVLTNETITLDIPAEPNGGATIDLNGVTLGSGSVLDVSNPTNSMDGAVVNLGGNFTIAAGATVAPLSNAFLSLGLNDAGATLVNNGTIDNTYLGFNSGTLSNNGVIIGDNGGSSETSSGVVVLNAGTILAAGQGSFGLGYNSSLTGGTLELAYGGMSLDSTLTATDVYFNNTGHLLLGVPNLFSSGAVVTGFGVGDLIALASTVVAQGATLDFNNGTLDLALGGTVYEAIPFSGNYGLGNFEETAGFGIPGAIAYAPSGGFSGEANPDIGAPATGTVAQGGTLNLSDVSIINSSTATAISITAGSGTLYMNGASGSGTNHVTLSGSTTQVNADLASLAYVPAAGASADTIRIEADRNMPDAANETYRWIPVTIGGGSSGPALTEPASETVSAGGTVAVSGSYSDSFAQGNPGSLFLGISDSSGTLDATDASGNAVAGSGTNHIALSTDYVDVNAILASLHYTASGSAGSDTINFDVWNQAGRETTGATAVTVDAPGLSMAGNFTGPGTMSSSIMAPATTNNGSGSSTMLNSANAQPIGVPLVFHP